MNRGTRRITRGSALLAALALIPFAIPAQAATPLARTGGAFYSSPHSPPRGCHFQGRWKKEPGAGRTQQIIVTFTSRCPNARQVVRAELWTEPEYQLRALCDAIAERTDATSDPSKCGFEAAIAPVARASLSGRGELFVKTQFTNPVPGMAYRARFHTTVYPDGIALFSVGACRRHGDFRDGRYECRLSSPVIANP
jgi:hypothetical protein